MSELISVLIADDNIEFCRMLHEYLEQSGDMTVKGIAKDGIETLKMIEDLEPDVVILDIIMPRLDGIGVLERLVVKPPVKRPIIIAFTAIGREVFIQKAIELGADYYIIKPFEVDALASRIRQLYSEKAEWHKQSANILKSRMRNTGARSSDMEQVVSILIKGLGITPNIAGYRYLREAVILCINQPSALKSVAKSIYPELADKYNTTSRNIDRAIRCAIDSANKKSKHAANDDQNLLATLGRSRPNNAQIIAFLAEKALRKML